MKHTNISPKKLFITGFILISLLLLGIAYSNSFSVPFHFDDLKSIPENPTIRHLAQSLIPDFKTGETTSGRPFLNFTFGLNFAAHQLHLYGYHLVNFMIHFLNVILLFLIFQKIQRDNTSENHSPLSFLFLNALLALLWGVHPVLTQSVTYIVQRAESLSSFFILFSLYAYIRAQNSPRRGLWSFSLLLSAFCGVATKETAGIIPIVLLAYGWFYLKISPQTSLSRHRSLYIGLALSWLFLLSLVILNKGRGDSAGFDGPLSSWSYLQAQVIAFWTYCKLILWPSPLIFDYGSSLTYPLSWVIPLALFAIALLALTALGTYQGNVGFFSFFLFFLLLAPTTSIIPIATQTISEHRVYLASAFFIFILGTTLYSRLPRITLSLIILLIPLLIWKTYERNKIYATPITLWQDTVQKTPRNVRAQNNLGAFLTKEGRNQEAIDHLLKAIELNPRETGAHNNLGYLFQQINQPDKALVFYKQAIEIDSTSPDPFHNMGLLFEQQNNFEQAFQSYQQAIDRNPFSTKSLINQGNILLRMGNIEEAQKKYEHCIQIRPEEPSAYNNLAQLKSSLQQTDQALQLFQKAIDLNPSNPFTYYNRGLLLQSLERWDEAIRDYLQAVKINSQFIEAFINIANIQLQTGKEAEAIDLYSQLINKLPPHPTPRLNLAQVLKKNGDIKNAKILFESVLSIDPQSKIAQEELALIKKTIPK